MRFFPETHLHKRKCCEIMFYFLKIVFCGKFFVCFFIYIGDVIFYGSFFARFRPN